MPWITLTPEKIWDGGLVVAGLVLLMFKKEILDFVKDSWKGAHKSLRLWSQRRNFVVQLTDKQVEDITGSGLDGLEASLYLLLEEYQADRITVMEYEPLADGGALATCLVQARLNEMPSVRHFQKTPISTELLHEITNIEQMHHRLRYVSDARQQDVVALRAAMLKSGAFSAYYQLISQPTQKPLRMLAFSWQRPHDLTPLQLTMLRFSGIMCSNVLSNLDKWKTTSND